VAGTAKIGERTGPRPSFASMKRGRASTHPRRTSANAALFVTESWKVVRTLKQGRAAASLLLHLTLDKAKK